MKTTIFAAATAFSMLLAGTAYANQTDNHSAEWHGHGSGHQGNNNPGDTAKDRHNFDAATAGNSGKNPAAATRSGKKD